MVISRLPSTMTLIPSSVRIVTVYVPAVDTLKVHVQRTE